MNDHLVSQWYGHCRLHQDEVPESRDLRGLRKVSDSDRSCQLTAVSDYPASQTNSDSYEDEEDVDFTSWPSTAWVPAAIEGCISVDAADDLLSLATLNPSDHLFDNQSDLMTQLPLPTNMSYAHYTWASKCLVRWDPFPEEKCLSVALTLSNKSPGNLLPCPYPEPQPLPLSFVTPSAAEENSWNKASHTNNSVNYELITLLMLKKKGKGVLMTEEPDPEAISPTICSPMTASGPVLTGPHPLDKLVQGRSPWILLLIQGLYAPQYFLYGFHLKWVDSNPVSWNLCGSFFGWQPSHFLIPCPL